MSGRRSFTRAALGVGRRWHIDQGDIGFRLALGADFHLREAGAELVLTGEGGLLFGLEPLALHPIAQPVDHGIPDVGLAGLIDLGRGGSG